MKKKFLKIALFCFSMLSALSLINNIEAASCRVYKDYYYFLDATDADVYENATKPYNRFTETTVPAGYAKNSTLKEEFQIKIVKEGAKSDTSWTLKKYYENYKKIIEKKEEDVGNNFAARIYTETESKTTVVRHILHGEWAEVLGTTGAVNIMLSISESYKNKTVDDLIASSIVPTGELQKLEGNGTGIKFIKKEKNKSLFDVKVERTYEENDLTGLTPTSAYFGETLHDAVYNTPAVYYIEYDYCTYNATINYVYADTGETVEFEDGSDNPYIEKGLEVDYTKEVESPELSKCKASDEVVKIEFDENDPKDFEYTVKYTCETPKYNATINYVYADTGKAVVFEDGSDNPYIEKGLGVDYTKEIESPDLPNCKPSDEVVKIEFDKNDPKDFEYTVKYTCETPKYNATINYVYADTGKAVVFEDGSDNPYIEKGLGVDYTKEIESPDLPNCKPSDEVVKIEFDENDPKDFKYTVKYTCEVENPPTGKYISFIGIATLIFSVGIAFLILKRKNYFSKIK